MAAEVDILAVDDVAGALQLALENAVAHAVGDRIRFVMADLVPPGEAPFDVILANLPYVATDALDRLPPPVTFEPRHALDGGPDGLGVIQRLVALLPEVLAQRGVAFFEIGADQRAGIIAVVEDLPGRWSCAVDDDLAGLPRIARVER
jgi:release factor glutamine methyltransferase